MDIKDILLLILPFISGVISAWITYFFTIKTKKNEAVLKFKEEKSPELNRYERWCNSAGNILKLKISKKDEAKFRKSFDIAHIEAEPWQALSLSVMVFLLVFFAGVLITP